MIDPGRLREEHQPTFDAKETERRLMLLVGGALCVLVGLKLGLHRWVLP